MDISFNVMSSRPMYAVACDRMALLLSMNPIPLYIEREGLLHPFTGEWVTREWTCENTPGLVKLLPREGDTASGQLTYLSWPIHLFIDAYAPGVYQELPRPGNWMCVLEGKRSFRPHGASCLVGDEHTNKPPEAPAQRPCERSPGCGRAARGRQFSGPGPGGLTRQ